MGGHAFSSGPNPLNVIRIPDPVYKILSAKHQNLLHTFYATVLVPPSAPEKVDHGDIDILVHTPLSTSHNTQIQLSEALGAERSTQGGGTTSFAMPFPSSNGTSSVDNASKAYYQLDIHTCRPTSFAWEAMVYSYGDLWHIIGVFITRFNLTINDRGLYLRVKEIEAKHKKDSLLFLTNEKGAMMQFLGLDKEAYERGFETLEELFQWAARSRFFRRRFFEKDVVSEKERKVREKRVMYGRFVKQWLPKQGKSSPEATTKQEENDALLATKVTEEALDAFNKRDEYTQMLASHRIRLSRDEIWKRVTRELPLEGKDLGRVIVALKKQVRWDEGGVVSLVDVEGRLVEEVDFMDEEAEGKVVEWCLTNWRNVIEGTKSVDGLVGSKKARTPPSRFALVDWVCGLFC